MVSGSRVGSPERVSVSVMGAVGLLGSRRTTRIRGGEAEVWRKTRNEIGTDQRLRWPRLHQAEVVGHGRGLYGTGPFEGCA